MSGRSLLEKVQLAIILGLLFFSYQNCSLEGFHVLQESSRSISSVDDGDGEGNNQNPLDPNDPGDVGPTPTPPVPPMQPPGVPFPVGDANIPNSATQRYRLTWQEDPSTTMIIGWENASSDDRVVKVYYDTSDHGRNVKAYRFQSRVSFKNEFDFFYESDDSIYIHWTWIVCNRILPGSGTFLFYGF